MTCVEGIVGPGMVVDVQHIPANSRERLYLRFLGGGGGKELAMADMPHDLHTNQPAKQHTEKLGMPAFAGSTPKMSLHMQVHHTHTCTLNLLGLAYGSPCT
jgi:hypothetical protein